MRDAPRTIAIAHVTNQWPPPPPPFSPPGTGSSDAPLSTGSRPSGPGPSRAVVAVIVALVTLLIAAGVAALIARDDKVITTAPTTTAAAATTRPGTASTGPQPGSSTTASPTEIDRFIDEAIVFIEKERGIDFVSKPTVVVLDDAAFVARFRELVEEDAREHAADFEALGGIFQAVGLLNPDMSYVDAQKVFGEAQVLGYYDQETKELRVRAGQLSPLTRITIVHELTHALDDQRFDLDRPEYDDADDEIGFGLAALAEGNAVRIENAYRDTLSSADRSRADAEERAIATKGASALTKLPLAFFALQIAPYDLGKSFVDAVIDKGGEAALERAFADPPKTSEQVIDPAKYFAKEARRTVAPPTADGSVLESGVFGQLALQIVLGAAVNPSVAQTAASGWAGDWFVAWRDANRVCLRADFVMDSGKDTNELRDALTKWAQKRPSGKVTNNGDAVEVTSCSR